MLNKNKSQRVAILKYGFSVPLFALMVVLSSATIEKSETVKTISYGIESGLPMLVETLSNGAIPIASKDEDIKLDELPLGMVEEQKPVGPALSKNTPADSVALDNIWRHFARKTRYPPGDQEIKKVGTNYLTFELDADGRIQNPSVVQAMSEGSKAEVYRVAKIAEPFGPGLAGKYILKINYRLNIGIGNNLTPPEESFDYTKYAGYQKVKELVIRGYVKLTPEESTEEKLRKYFANTIKYPGEAFKNNLTSSSSVVFEIDQSGNIINPSSMASNGKPFEDELMRVLKTAKTFEDVLAGKYILPVLFVIDDKAGNNGNSPHNPKNSSDYKKLNPILIMGHVEAAHPDSIITFGGWQMSFTPGKKTIFSYVTSDEEGGIVNYIKVDYLKDPVILHNGKVVTYKTTDKGFKLDNPFYPKQPKITIYTGDDAVKNYNESVRTKGLIVVTTE